MTCIPRDDAKRRYFLFFRDERSWIGWFPSEFAAALNKYVSSLRHPRTSNMRVSAKKIAEYGKSEFLCISGGSAGIALSVLVWVNHHTFAGKFLKRTEFSRCKWNFFEFSYFKSTKTRQKLIRKRL